MSSLQTVSRLLALIPYLRRHGTVTVAETAKEFEVSEDQLLDDLQTLVFCGLPDEVFRYRIDIDMDVAHEEGLITIRDADFLPRPTRFTPNEVLALTVALQSMRDISPAEAGAAIDSALAKLVAATESALQIEIQIENGDPENLAALHDAIADRQVVVIRYEKASGVSELHVEPHRLMSREGFAYLEGWDLPAQEWRYYRLDRITSVRRTEDPVLARPLLPVVESWAEVFAEAPAVRLELEPPAHWIVDYYPVTVLDQSCPFWEVEIRVASRPWFIALMLRLGDAARVLEPKSAAEDVRQAVHEALAAYQNLARL